MIEIDTRLGRVRGIQHGGGQAFLGLPFALPPTGRRRFAPPEPCGPWTGTYDATALAARCPQPPAPPLIGGPTADRQDEDCLYLNIYTPEADGRVRPVLFWIHGGAYTQGSANDFDGSTLAMQGDVVVVCTNYRLGLLGFADLSRLGQEMAGSASNGIRDQIEALRWVAHNIVDYGGDPGNVTIFGESAGAGSVLALLAAPSADGLYHRAIAASPGGATTPPVDAVPALTAALGVGEELLLDRLRQLSAAELLDLQITSGASTSGAIDGVVVTRPFSQAIRDRGTTGVPVIAGTTRDEGTLLTEIVDPSVFEATTAAIALGVMRGDDPGAYLSALQATYPEADAQTRHTLVWTNLFRRAAIHAAEAASAAGPGGWLYRFDLPTTELGGRLGATHGSDIGFIFNIVGGPDPV